MQRNNSDNIPQPFGEAIERFFRVQEGRNRSKQTLRAYRSDLSQLAEWLHLDNPLLTDPVDVTTDDLHEFLAHLAHDGISGTSRSRKLAAIREFYRSLMNLDLIVKPPVDAIDTPRTEKKTLTCFTPEEYNRLLAAAGAHPRNFCILTLFIQTGIRISELCELRIDDLDLEAVMHLIDLSHGNETFPQTVPL